MQGYKQDLLRVCPRCGGDDIAVARDGIATRKCRSCGFSRAPKQWLELHEFEGEKSEIPAGFMSAAAWKERARAELEEKERSKQAARARFYEQMCNAIQIKMASQTQGAILAQFDFGEHGDQELCERLASELKNAGWAVEVEYKEVVSGPYAEHVDLVGVAFTIVPL